MYYLPLEITIPLIILVGFFSSTIASTIGLGGGLVAVPLILLVIGEEKSEQAKLIAYVSLVFLSIVAIFRYWKQKRKPLFNKTFFILLGVIPSTIIFELYSSHFFHKNSFQGYFHLFYFLVIIFVTLLINFKNKIKLKKILPNWSLILIGLFIGFLSGTFGLSGGVIFMPLLVVGLKVDLKQAAVTSLALKFFVSLSNVITAIISKQFQGFELNGVYWFLPLLIIIGAFFGSLIGPKINKKLTNKNIKWIFNIIMTSSGILELVEFIIFQIHH